ncbi:MAG: hypothetical protein FJ304_26915 [Planctomycetes bacterium]|nr:hypothetical protein [Planctomycetota bacterium]
MNELQLRSPTSAAQMEQAVPALPPAEVLRRNLLYAMLKAVGEDDMAAIVARQVEKAKDGDTRSARLVIELVQASATAPSPTHMQQAIVVTGQEKEIRFLSDTRRNLVHLLNSAGSMTTVEVARAMHLRLNDAAGALDHDWFVKSQDRWYLTRRARVEVLLEASSGQFHDAEAQA